MVLVLVLQMLIMEMKVGLPKLSEGIFEGFRDKDLFLRKFQEIRDTDPVLYAMYRALCDDAENDLKAESVVDMQVGIMTGMVYTYMLLQAQADADDLKKQWGNNTS